MASTAALPTAADPASRYSLLRQFWVLGRRGSIAAIGCHLGFLVLFAALDLPRLAAFELVSIGAYAAILACAHVECYGPTLPLFALELFTHALLTSWYLGWDASFHLYLLLFIPISLQSPHGLPLRLSVAIGVALAYTGLDLWLAGAAAHGTVAAGTLMVLRLANLCCFLCLFVLLCMVYAHAVRAAQEGLRLLAERDPLTGLCNRRSLLREAGDLLTRGTGAEGGLWLVFVDIDHFKGVNDAYGHATGDAAIVLVAERIRSSVRTQDLVARWGGEEFLVILPAASRETALAVAERILLAVRVRQPERAAAPLPPLTVTVGVAEHRAGEDLERAVARADAALYAGKRGGRDRVELARPNPEPDPEPSPSSGQRARATRASSHTGSGAS